MTMISEGAEAKLYSTKLLGIDAVVKRRFPKGYRVKPLDEALRRQRTKIEARALAHASSFGVRVPTLLLLDEFDIYMSRLHGTTLSKMIDNGIGGAELNGIMSEAGAYLGLLHEAGIAHGDYTPANIMVCGGAAYVIDFGLAAMSSSVEEMALDLLLMKRSVSSPAFAAFMASYAKAYEGSDKTEGRLNSIEKRGRYQTRTLTSV